MTDLPLEDIGQFRDMLGVWLYHAMTDEAGVPAKEALAYANRFGRDKCRTPMQWDNAPNAGFSPASIAPWLPVNPNYAQGVNVASQWDNPGSLLSFYKRMLRVRRNTPALIAGDYIPLHQVSEDYLAFLRHSQDDSQTCLVVLNMSQQTHRLSFSLTAPTGHVIFSSHNRDRATDDLSKLYIASFEVYIAELR